MKARSRPLLCFTLCLVNYSVMAYDVNKDLRNLGPAAHDVAVVLTGNETVINHYDGYPWANFGSFAHGPSGGNTLLRWRHFWDGSDDRIDNGQVIHVGWSTADHSSSVLDMYWTDQCGDRIPGSVVHNITSGWTYETTNDHCVATWENNFPRDSLVTISNVRYALPDQRLELGALTGHNEALMQSLRPLDVRSVTLCNGENWSVPIPESAFRSVVLVYDVTSPNSAASATDYVQFNCFPEVSTNP